MRLTSYLLSAIYSAERGARSDRSEVKSRVGISDERHPHHISQLVRFIPTCSKMFGFIHESIRQLMLRKYGEELWQDVLTRAGFENGKENIVNHYYSDSDTYLLVDSVAVLTSS
ncbi:unnamed protein product, partial [Heligmosomoides polygyrus]|uniref:HNOB domain-containing protein n=1 Tax=Heligmosomoides polygyrus TaxID=6339 RepID=A0A183F8S1_HELPZ